MTAACEAHTEPRPRRELERARPRTPVRGPPNDGATGLPLQLPAPHRRADEPQSPRADRRADPRLPAAADDLRPPASTPQRVHPADPPHPEPGVRWPYMQSPVTVPGGAAARQGRRPTSESASDAG